jgi:hypothetical protein
MPRKPSGKATKQKLSKEQRSQIAKDRWTKIRAARKQEDDKTFALIHTSGESESARADLSIVPAPPIVEQESPTGRDENGVPPVVGLGDGTINPNGEFVPDHPPAAQNVGVWLNEGGKVVGKVMSREEFSNLNHPVPIANSLPTNPVAPPVELPAPQLALVKAPKPKRYQGPKEFSGALKAAEKRLAKAINERAEAMGKLAGLNAEIPSLLQIIQALKGSNNLPPTPFDFSGGVPNAQAFQAPIDPQAALMAAMAAPPVSRASGGAVQFSPDVVGSLEGPDDDDPDKFLEGPHAGGGWIGG